MKLTKKRARPRNQRVSNVRQRRQQHLLDVKVRSRSATQHRNRRVVVVLSKIALVVALGLGLYAGGRLVAPALPEGLAKLRLLMSTCACPW